jgi:hypothetical protein
MRELRDRVCLALEACASVGIAGDVRREDLDGDGAIEAGVFGAVDLAHPSYADEGLNFVGTEAGAGGQRHRGWSCEAVYACSAVATFRQLRTGLPTVLVTETLLRVSFRRLGIRPNGVVHNDSRFGQQSHITARSRVRGRHVCSERRPDLRCQFLGN